MAETKKILERKEIEEKDRWAIEDLYPNDEAWSKDLEKLKALLAHRHRFDGHGRLRRGHLRHAHRARRSAH